MQPDLVEREFAHRALRRGGILYLLPDVAIEVVVQAKELDIQVLGLDGFILADESTQPSMEHSIDFSGTTHGSHEAALDFISANRLFVTHFEVVLSDSRKNPVRTGSGEGMLGTSHTFERVKAAVAARQVRISQHGFLELEEDDILPDEIFESVLAGLVVEDYPDAWKGPSVLVRQTLAGGKRIHALWGFAKNGSDDAVLITAYVPSGNEWSGDFLKRKAK